MLLIVLGLLVATACVSGTPTCDQLECINDQLYQDPFPTTPEELDNFCPSIHRMTDCQIDYNTRCIPHTVNSLEMDGLLQERKKFYTIICSNCSYNHFRQIAAACVSGSPACEEGMEKCRGGRPVGDPYRTTPEALDDFCPFALSVLDCQIDYTKRCPPIKYVSKETLEGVRELFGKICSNTDLRRIYLKNIVCVKEVGRKSGNECESKDKDDCKSLNHLIGCVRQKTAEACGTEAVEVYDAVMKPVKAGMEARGCKGVKLFGMGAFAGF